MIIVIIITAFAPRGSYISPPSPLESKPPHSEIKKTYLPCYIITRDTRNGAQDLNVAMAGK